MKKTRKYVEWKLFLSQGVIKNSILDETNCYSLDSATNQIHHEDGIVPSKR